MKMKRIMALGLAIVMSLSLIACGSKKKDQTEDTAGGAATTESGGSTEQTAASDEKTVLRMAWWGSQTRHDATVKVIELYESKNPNIDIQYEFYDSEGYFTKLDTLVASNEVWDCFQMGGNFPTYLEQILPLDDFIASGVIDTSKTTDAFLQTTQFDGKQVGISNGVNTYGIAYDPAMFAEAGVPEPTETWTWEDYKNACLTIHDKLDIFGSSKLEDFIAGCSMNVSQEDYALNFYKPTLDQLGFDDYNLLTDYMAMRADLVKAGAYPDMGALEEIKDIEGDYLVTGEAAMTWVASNQFIALSDAAGKELKLATIPRRKADGPSGATINSSQMFCISKNSQHAEEAAKFLNFFWTDEEANMILANERGNTIFSNVSDALAANATPQQTAVSDFVNLIGTFKTGEISVLSPTADAEIRDQYKLLIGKVTYGEMTPEEGAKEMYEFTKAKLEQSK